jgi:hypothetical protein
MTRRAFAVCIACAFLSSLSLGAAPARKSPAFDGTVVNSTAHDLVRSEETLPSGKWCGEPPETIKSGETASFCAEGTAGSTGGTQGSVTYKIGETETTVTMNFAVDENQISHSQSAAFTTNGFRANIAGVEDCARSWRGTPHCFCNYTFTIKVNR